MSTTCLMSELKPGDQFKLMLGRDVVDLPMQLVAFDGEFAVCRNLHPQLSDQTAKLSVPGAMVRLIENTSSSGLPRPDGTAKDRPAGR